MDAQLPTYAQSSPHQVIVSKSHNNNGQLDQETESDFILSGQSAPSQPSQPPHFISQNQNSYFQHQHQQKEKNKPESYPIKQQIKALQASEGLSAPLVTTPLVASIGPAVASAVLPVTSPVSSNHPMVINNNGEDNNAMITNLSIMNSTQPMSSSENPFDRSILKALNGNNNNESEQN
ncbi:unnamed protein product [[Candida] boidinii]|nr:unnamed protein product [[Candida] boidinii]GME99324.1 unnamed protein product [[Candida] boidinii]